MVSVTKLLASNFRAKELVRQLEEAIRASKETGETSYAQITLEQILEEGPWRLIIGVLPKNER